jgi:bifunctional enzyme CysN/CysC
MRAGVDGVGRPLYAFVDQFSELARILPSFQAHPHAVMRRRCDAPMSEMLRDTGDGVIAAPRAIESRHRGRRELTWQPAALARDERWTAISQSGATVLLTGLPASGKSTIARALERRLVDAGQSAYVLDGDNIRHGLSDDLGFSPGDRAEHIRRVGHVALLMADSGTIALLSLISPLAQHRAHLRTVHDHADLPFVEVFVDTPVDECERRDPKGLYARARAGQIKDFTGVDAPYEPPEDPELRVDTATTGVKQAVAQIIEILRPGQRPRRRRPE